MTSPVDLLVPTADGEAVRGAQVLLDARSDVKGMSYIHTIDLHHSLLNETDRPRHFRTFRSHRMDDRSRPHPGFPVRTTSVLAQQGGVGTLDRDIQKRLAEVVVVASLAVVVELKGGGSTSADRLEMDKEVRATWPSSACEHCPPGNDRALAVLRTRWMAV